MSDEDELEAAIRLGAVNALRKRSGALAERAKFGTTETATGVVIRSSEAAHTETIAQQFARIADEIEAGA